MMCSSQMLRHRKSILAPHHPSRRTRAASGKHASLSQCLLNYNAWKSPEYVALTLTFLLSLVSGMVIAHFE